MACERLSEKAGMVPPLAPEECVVFEDSEAGLQSGLSAGMYTVVVWSGR